MPLDFTVRIKEAKQIFSGS